MRRALALATTTTIGTGKVFLHPTTVPVVVASARTDGATRRASTLCVIVSVVSFSFRARLSANSRRRDIGQQSFASDPRFFGFRRRRTKILDGSVWCVRGTVYSIVYNIASSTVTDSTLFFRFRSRRHLDGRKGELVGEDALGNKYYQNQSYQQGRNRWVVPPNPNDYSAANIPREWHGWLHHMNDEPGLPNAVEPTYEDAAPLYVEGKSSAGTYLPKGHFLRARPGEVTRSWARYQSWTPN